MSVRITAEFFKATGTAAVGRGWASNGEAIVRAHLLRNKDSFSSLEVARAVFRGVKCWREVTAEMEERIIGETLANDLSDGRPARATDILLEERDRRHIKTPYRLYQDDDLRLYGARVLYDEIVELGSAYLSPKNFLIIRRDTEVVAVVATLTLEEEKSGDLTSKIKRSLRWSVDR